MVNASSGYDLPLFGIGSWEFPAKHVSSIVSLLAGMICNAAVIFHISRKNNIKDFFDWKIAERVVVYVAMCDTLYNHIDIYSHITIYSTESYVHPMGFCRFLGFVVFVSNTAQSLLVNVIAITTVLLICYHKKINYGTYDHRLLIYVLGVPFVMGVIAASLGHLGPSPTL